MDINRIFDHCIASTEDDGCWLWTRALNNKGYGVANVLGRQTLAHRLAYEFAVGPIPTGLFILHKCDNPRCINPKHLSVGSQRDNMQDAIMKGRMSKPPKNFVGRHVGKMPKGEALWNNSLTEERAREIMRLHMQRLNITQISEAVGTPKHVVADVCRGRSWRHLEGIPSIEELKTGGVRRGVNQFT